MSRRVGRGSGTTTESDLRRTENCGESVACTYVEERRKQKAVGGRACRARVEQENTGSWTREDGSKYPSTCRLPSLKRRPNENRSHHRGLPYVISPNRKWEPPLDCLPVLRPRVFTPFSRPSSSYFPFRLFASFFFFLTVRFTFWRQKAVLSIARAGLSYQNFFFIFFFLFLMVIFKWWLSGNKSWFFFFMKMNFRTIYYSVRKRKRNCQLLITRFLRWINNEDVDWSRQSLIMAIVIVIDRFFIRMISKDSDGSRFLFN